MAGKPRRRRHSRIATTVTAVRRAHRRHTHRATGAPSPTAAAKYAIRDANPRTLSGLAAQGMAVSAIAAVEHRGRLAPIIALGVLLPLEQAWPTQTAVGLTVTAVAAGTAAWRTRKAGWCGQNLGVAAGSAGALAFTGLTQAGVLDHLTWWQWAGVLGASWAPGARAWWRPMLPEPESLESGPQIALPAEMQVLHDVITDVIGIERSLIAGGRIVSLDHPAPQVATAIIALPGLHTRQLPLATLRDGLEAMGDEAGQNHPSLGALAPGSVEVTATGVSQIQVTMSWSKALSTGVLAYEPPDGLPEGTVWLGRSEDRRDVLVPGWSRGSDARVSCHHVKIIGANGSGKSVTGRALLLGGLSSAKELVLPLDGKGDSLDELARLVPGGRIARDADSWAAGIELFGAIFLSRKQRQGTPDAWREPREDDPLITLYLDEAAMIGSGVAPEHHWILAMGARQTRSLGMRTIQASQVPLIDEWVGGGAWRSQASITLLHALRDETHARIAAQGLSTPIDVTLLPRHYAAVAFDAEVTTGKCRVAMITEDDITAITRTARLHPIDAAAAEGAWRAYVHAVTEGTPGSIATDPLAAALRSLGTPGISAGPLTATALPGAVAPGSVPAQTSPQVIDLRGTTPVARTSKATLRETILTRLLTATTWPTRPDLVQDLQDEGWSRSGAHKAIGQLLSDGALIEEAGRLAPAILAN